MWNFSPTVQMGLFLAHKSHMWMKISISHEFHVIKKKEEKEGMVKRKSDAGRRKEGERKEGERERKARGRKEMGKERRGNGRQEKERGTVRK